MVGGDEEPVQVPGVVQGDGMPGAGSYWAHRCASLFSVWAPGGGGVVRPCRRACAGLSFFRALTVRRSMSAEVADSGADLVLTGR